MTVIGAEQKLTFWIACFRFCPKPDLHEGDGRAFSFLRENPGDFR